MLSDEDSIVVYRRWKRGDTVREIARDFALGERDVNIALNRLRTALEEEETVEDAPEPQPDTTPIRPTFCTNCHRHRLGPNNRSGICSPCQRSKPYLVRKT